MKIQHHPQSQPRPPLTRPATESWTVGAQTYPSTADLLQHADEVAGQPAIYNFTKVANQAPYSGKEKLANTVGHACTGALMGGLMGGAVSGLIGFLSGVGSVVEAVAGGRGSRAGTTLVPLALGLVLGAGAGAVQGWSADPTALQSHVTGTLKKSGDHLAFYPHGQVEREVDLQRFQQAPEAAPVQDTRYGTLESVAIGAGMGLASCHPLTGFIAGPVSGSRLGASLDKRTQLGSGLGAALGLTLPIATIALGRAFDGPGAAAAVLAVTTAGAILGPGVLRGGEPESDGQSQWWQECQDPKPDPFD